MQGDGAERDNEENLAEFKDKAQKRIMEHYSWYKVADQYEALFYDVVNGKYPWKLNLSRFF